MTITTQGDTSKERHGRPKPEYVKTLHRATKHDYHRLLVAVVHALLTHQISVTIATSYLTRFPSDFPKGLRIRKEGFVDYRAVQAKKLLKWLRDHGYTDITEAQLGLAQQQFYFLERGVLNEHL